jgi:DNA-binding beta-propeller fold protein YncE
MARVQSPRFTRRHWLLGAAAGLACGRQKATGYAGYAFVANRDSHSVSAIDLTRFRVWKHIPLGAAPSEVVAHPTKSRVFVLTPAAGAVCEIDAASLAVSRRVRAGSDALSIRLAPAGDALWVFYRNPAEAVEFPLDSLQPRRRFRLPVPPDDVDVSRDGQAAIAFHAGRSIAVASLATASIEHSIATRGEPSLVRFQSDGRQILVGSRSDRTVTIFDTASGRTVVRLPIPLEPRNFCFGGGGGQLFVTGEGRDGVVIVFPYATEVAETILAGHAPGSMAATDAPPYLMVANPEASRITVLDVDTRKLVAVVGVGLQPGSIVVTPDAQYALVLNQGSGDVAVIRIRALSARRFKSAPLFTMIPVGSHPVSAACVAVG